MTLTAPPPVRQRQPDEPADDPLPRDMSTSCTYAWQEQAFARCKLLRAAWAVLPLSPAGGGVKGRAEASLEELLTAAEDACLTRPGFRSRLRGTAVERAWTSIHAAEALLLAVGGPAAAQAALPHTAAQVKTQLGAAHPERVRVEALVKKGDALTAADAVALALAGHAAHDSSAAQHVRVRSFRNVVLVATVSLLVMVVAVVALGALKPTAVPMCDGAGDTCVTGGPAERLDALVVATLGAAAGMLAGAGALRRVQGSSTPYSVTSALMFLKVPAGALTALLGVLLLRAGAGGDDLGTGTSQGLLAWAVLFGSSQQLVTRLADLQGQDVLERVKSGRERPAGGAAED